MRSYLTGRPRQIDKVRIRIAGEALDVLCTSKRVFFLGRSVTPHAVESESCTRYGKWGIVIVNTLSIPDFRPVPTVL